MEESNIQYIRSGVGFNGLLILLGVIFCILEGAGVISWGWILCCVPFFIVIGELAVSLGLFLIASIIALIYCLLKR